MLTQPLSKQELDNWLLDPVTKKVRIKIMQLIQEIKDNWADGKFKDNLVDAEERGRIKGLSEIFEVESDE